MSITGDVREAERTRYLGLRILPSEVDLLKQRARTEGRTVSELIRLAARQYLAQPPKSKP